MIRVRGARVHNLVDVDVDLPRNALVVLTGPSGSGKSSLAIDTIYAEAQRRYVESLGGRARRVLSSLPRPDVDSVEGLSPAICVEQRAATRSPRSTVGTATEVHDALRVLFARCGVAHCPTCDVPAPAHTVPEVVDVALALPEGTRLSVVAPLAQVDGASLASLGRQGFVRARVDGVVVDLASLAEPPRSGLLDVVIDRVASHPRSRGRIAESVELAFGLSGGRVTLVPEGGEEIRLADRPLCPVGGHLLPSPSSAMFSFNSPEGACPACLGLGVTAQLAVERVVPDPTRSLRDGAIVAWGGAGRAYQRDRLAVLEALPGVDLDVPFASLPAKTRRTLLHGGRLGGAAYEGILPGIERRARDLAARRAQRDAGEEAVLDALEAELGPYRVTRDCERCGGARLRPEALAVRAFGLRIGDLLGAPIADARAQLARVAPEGGAREVARPLLAQISDRLGFLMDVGVGYLSLDRGLATLSAGEAQRVRLATRLGLGLVGVLYVLDEPTAGLHPADAERLLATLRAVRDRGSSLLVVEHEEVFLRGADHIVDMGPGAGRRGGRVVAEGPPEVIAAHPESSTGAYLSGRSRIEVPARRRGGADALRVREALTHNLTGVAADFPIGALTCVTGVSGGGKSSLVLDTLVPLVEARLAGVQARVPARLDAGGESITRVVHVDQSPIGRSPRSSAATYVGLWGPLRELFASLPDARAKGWGASRFGLDRRGGRCEACRGEGLVRVSMELLPDVFVTCEHCEGRRFERETLEVRYRGLSIADILEADVDRLRDVLGAIPGLSSRLESLAAVGLGYLPVGRRAASLSGGEAQRVRLARELSRRRAGDTLYVLDEPTTGLATSDVHVLVTLLGDLVARGDTVVVVEHDQDVVKVADHVIELGPRGGPEGGRVVASGTPEQLARAKGSPTAPFLRNALQTR